MAVRGVRYWPRLWRYAVFGTDIGYGPTSSTLPPRLRLPPHAPPLPPLTVQVCDLRGINLKRARVNLKRARGVHNNGGQWVVLHRWLQCSQDQVSVRDLAPEGH
eukprot:1835062-Rhodomonas_salina.1